MNKLTKGAIAGAAGIALLLGGAGSFALWNGNATAAAGEIQSGTLSVTATGASSWQNTPYGSSTPASITLSNFKAVPGDTLTLTQTLNVTSIGDNLNATLAVDPASIVAPTPDLNGANAALKAALIQSMTVSISGTQPSNIVAGSTANTFTVTNATAPQTVTIVVKLPFPRGTAGDNSTQAGSVDLSGLKFTLTQN